MAKIRIPRKKKKMSYWKGIPDLSLRCHPYVPKLMKYCRYMDMLYFTKHYHLSAEELYGKIGCITIDMIIWYHWVRKKHLGIEPKMSKEFQEYWDYFVKKGVIKF